MVFLVWELSGDRWYHARVEKLISGAFTKINGFLFNSKWAKQSHFLFPIYTKLFSLLFLFSTKWAKLSHLRFHFVQNEQTLFHFAHQNRPRYHFHFVPFEFDEPGMDQKSNFAQFVTNTFLAGSKYLFLNSPKLSICAPKFWSNSYNNN